MFDFCKVSVAHALYLLLESVSMNMDDVIQRYQKDSRLNRNHDYLPPVEGVVCESIVEITEHKHCIGEKVDFELFVDRSDAALHVMCAELSELKCQVD